LLKQYGCLVPILVGRQSILDVNFTPDKEKGRHYFVNFFSSSLLPLWSIGLISQFLDHSQTVGLLGRVISSSQGLCLNTGQHKHRKTHTHIKHLCPEWGSNPRSRPPRERRQYMPFLNCLYVKTSRVGAYEFKNVIILLYAMHTSY
jgi:hypothetical protein